MKEKPYHLMVILAAILLWAFPFEGRLVAEEGLKISTIVVSRDVVDRVPVEAGSQFGEDVERLYCFTAVSNPGAPTTITHVWSREGEEVARVDLNVGTSPNWRTWSTKRILPAWAGSWEVSVLDAMGTEIASVDFRVGPGEVAPEEMAEPEAAPEVVPEAPPAAAEEAAPEVAPEAPPAAAEEAAPEVEAEEEAAPEEEKVPEAEPETPPAPPEEEVAPEGTAEPDTSSRL